MKTLANVLKLYDQPWRYYHNRNHLSRMREGFKFWPNLTDDSKELLEHALVFHDAVYEPTAKDNEEKSVQLWMEFASENNIPLNIVEQVNGLILSTKDPKQCKSDIEKAFNQADWNNMSNTHIINENYARFLDEYESGIFREYQFVPVEKYIEARLEFIEKSQWDGLMTPEVGNYLRPLICRKKRIGIYAGSFFPFHVGHLNILRKAETMFDKVIVAKGINPEKKYDGDYDNVQNILKHHEVEKYVGQLVDYVNSKRSNYCEPVLVRGLRNGYDLNQEVNLINFINEQADARHFPRIPIVYIHCDKEYEHVSSSAIRMLEKDDAARYIPDVQ